MSKKSKIRARNPEAARNKYPKRIWIRTTPETLDFLQAVKRILEAPNIQEVINHAFKTYHRHWRKLEPNRIPPLTRRKRGENEK